jgi:serine/threonine-protein kinase ATR
VAQDVLLNQIEGFQPSQASTQLSLPFAVEASWVTGKWAKLKKYLTESRLTLGGDFNVGVGSALLALSQDETDHFSDILDRLRQNTAKSLSATNAVSLQSCHDAMLQFHVLTEIEVISGIRNKEDMERSSLVKSLNQRLDVLGAFLSDKQYILGLRRATMQVSK